MVLGPLSKTWVEGIITDTLGSTTNISSQENVGGSVISHITLQLVNGTNTISIPAGSRGVIISCDILCDSIKTLKGVAGDTGIQIFTALAGGQQLGIMMLLFGSAPGASFVVDSVGADTSWTQFFFF